MLTLASPGATFLINSPYPKENVWDQLPLIVQETILRKKSGSIPLMPTRSPKRPAWREGSIPSCRPASLPSPACYPKRRPSVISKRPSKNLFQKRESGHRTKLQCGRSDPGPSFEVTIPSKTTALKQNGMIVSEKAPGFVKEVVARMMEGRGDELPVSVMPPDGTYPSGTTKWEKRNISDMVATWEPDICIQCGNCSFVCPHAVIRAKFYHEDVLQNAPDGFKSAPINARGFPETKFTIQVYGEDCTGCNLCVYSCPATDPNDRSKRAINLQPILPNLEQERANIDYFETIPFNDRSTINFSMVHGAQFLNPCLNFQEPVPDVVRLRISGC